MPRQATGFALNFAKFLRIVDRETRFRVAGLAERRNSVTQHFLVPLGLRHRALQPGILMPTNKSSQRLLAVVIAVLFMRSVIASDDAPSNTSHAAAADLCRFGC